MKTKVTMTFEEDPEDPSNDYNLKCAMSGVKLNGSISEALDAIRARLKYGAEILDAEEKILETLRSILREHYIE